MSVNEIIILAAIGLVAGFASGTLGIGGAIIMVPAMIYFLGMSQHNAQGTSLAVLLMPVGIFAVMNYYNKGYVNFKFALVLILAFIVGGYFGSLFAVHVPEKVLKKIFALLLLFVGFRMILSK